MTRAGMDPLTRADVLAAVNRLRHNSIIKRRLTSEWPSMAQLRSDVKIIVDGLPAVLAASPDPARKGSIEGPTDG